MPGGSQVANPMRGKPGAGYFRSALPKHTLMKSVTTSPIPYLKQLIMLALSIAFLGLVSGSAFAEDEYSFKVHNKTKVKITKILVSENGKKYAPFDIGKGIGPGKKVTLVWDKSTNSESCKQFVKAVYADGDESEPAKFNFCEEDLVLEFE